MDPDNNDGFMYPRPPLPRIDNTTYVLPDTQYVHQASEKTGIVLHHTVSRSVASVYDWWNEKNDRKVTRVGTSYVIGEDGTIYSFFPDEMWAWHLGAGVPTEDEARTIGIEIVSEGGLVPVDGQTYAFWNPRTKKGVPHNVDVVDLGKIWRGYRYFDGYSAAQISSVIVLLDYLCDKHNIPRKVHKNLWDYNASIKKFQGIFTHAQVRSDKTDVHPMFPIVDIAKWCRLEIVDK